MPDLEDVLTMLDKFKTKAKEFIEFIGLLEKLFGNWDAAEDQVAELCSTDIGELIEEINKVLIEGK